MTVAMQSLQQQGRRDQRTHTRGTGRRSCLAARSSSLENLMAFHMLSLFVESMKYKLKFLLRSGLIDSV